MKPIHSFFVVLSFAAVMLAWGGSAHVATPVSVGYGASVPSSCPAGSPTLFVQHGSTGLVTNNACQNGVYSQVLQSERFADAETPSGAIDGAHSQFKLAHLPNPANSLELMKNGLVLRQGADYTLNQQTIMMATPPAPATSRGGADALQAWYRY